MQNLADNQYPYLKKFSGWRLMLAWIGLFAFGWIIFGVVFKICIRLFFLGWDLV